MQVSTRLPRRCAAQGAARRTLLLSIAGCCLLFAACASTSRSSEGYLVLESQRFT